MACILFGAVRLALATTGTREWVQEADRRPGGARVFPECPGAHPPSWVFPVGFPDVVPSCGDIPDFVEGDRHNPELVVGLRVESGDPAATFQIANQDTSDRGSP